MKNKYEVKDFILMGVLVAVYFVLFMTISSITAITGSISHLLSPIISAIISGIIFLLIISKVPKKGVFTISSIIFLGIMLVLGMGYLPWIISILITALIADLICVPSNYKNLKTIAMGWGLINVGHMLGSVVPMIFFASSMRETFISRGVDPIFIDTMINFVKGPMSFVLILVAFLAGILGMFIANKLMNKHFKKAGIA